MVFGQNVVTQGGLDVEEGSERQTSEAAVLLVFDLAVGGIAEGGAQDADGGLAVALNFEMDGVSSLDGLKIPTKINDCKVNISKCMATFETRVSINPYGDKGMRGFGTRTCV